MSAGVHSGSRLLESMEVDEIHGVRMFFVFGRFPALVWAQRLPVPERNCGRNLGNGVSYGRNSNREAAVRGSLLSQLVGSKPLYTLELCHTRSINWEQFKCIQFPVPLG